MAFNSKIQRDAIALTYQAINQLQKFSLGDSVKLLTRAIALDPTLDLPRVTLFDLISRTSLMQNLKKPTTAVTLQRFLPRPTAPLPLGSEQILEDLRTFMSIVDALPASDGSATTPQWSEKKRIARHLALNFTDPRHIVQIAQNLNLCGFDHRVQDGTYLKVINAKAKLLEKAFGINPFHIPELRDSPHSLAHTLMNVMGRPVSSSTFWHASFLMRILAHIEFTPLRILEIGGGYGGLAMLFNESGHCRQYVIVDLPESLIYAHTFLKLTFPEADIRLCATESDVAHMGDAAFVLVPAQLSGKLAGEKFDVGLSTGSFQEMPASTARGYMHLLQNVLNIKYFYSINYYLENKDLNRETSPLSDDERNLTSPELDANWEVLHFEINPPHIIMDSPRNWCEVLLRRVDEGAPVSRSTKELISTIDSLEFGGQAWFQQVWMALWRAPTRRLVDRYLAGIKGFSEGSVPVRESRTRNGKLGQPYEGIGEVLYWRERRDNLPD